MIPIVFGRNAPWFSSQGYGRLVECGKCTVTEERNGLYECEFTYPMDGKMFNFLVEDAIIYTTHGYRARPEPFYIYKRTATLDGMVKFNARHISYRLNNRTVRPFTATSCAEALENIALYTVGGNRFHYSTDKTTTGNFAVTTPKQIRSVLGGSAGSILDVYGGGEYEWRQFDIILHRSRGVASGVTIRYGKNLTEFEQELDFGSVYNAYVPFWKDDAGNVVMLSGDGYITADDDTNRVLKTQPLDLSAYWETAPTDNELYNKAEEVIAGKTPYKATENIKVDFVNLANTAEYKSMEQLQALRLCDTVDVFYTKLGVTATNIKIVKTVYDSLNERYIEMNLGTIKRTFSEVVTDSVIKTLQSKGIN